MAQKNLTKEQEDERAERGKQLVWDALEKLGKLPPYPYGEADEDLVNEVYEAIAKNPILLMEYAYIAQYHSDDKKYGGKHGAHSFNPSITLFVKDITDGKDTGKQGNCKDGGLAKTYMKLEWS